jgi:hypothetical protein
MRSEEFIDVALAPRLNAASLIELGNEFGWVPDRVDLFLQGLGLWPSRLTGWPKLIGVPLLEGCQPVEQAGVIEPAVEPAHLFCLLVG